MRLQPFDKRDFFFRVAFVIPLRWLRRVVLKHAHARNASCKMVMNRTNVVSITITVNISIMGHCIVLHVKYTMS